MTEQNNSPIEESKPKKARAPRKKKEGPTAEPGEQLSLGVEAAKPEKKDFKEQIKEFVNKEENKDNLLKWAELFNERFHGNWFTLDKIIKKTALKNPNEALKVISLLMILDLAHSKNERSGIISYKVTLNVTEKVRLLELDLVEVDKRRNSLIEAIQRLQQDSSK